MRDGGQTIPNASDCNTIFIYTPDAWYDQREGRYVDLFDIDMNKLFNWSVSDSVARTTNILYVTFTNEGSAPDPKGDGVRSETRTYEFYGELLSGASPF